MINKQFFRVFQLFAREVKNFQEVKNFSEKHLKEFANHVHLVKMI